MTAQIAGSIEPQTNQPPAAQPPQEARTVCGACSPNFFQGRSTATGLALARLSRDILFEDGAAALDALVGGGGPTPAFERVVEVRGGGGSLRWSAERSVGPNSTSNPLA